MDNETVINTKDPKKQLFQGWLMALTASWILFSAILVLAGYGLSWVGMFNRTGYIVVLLLAFAVAAWPPISAWRQGNIRLRFSKRRYKRAFPLLFLVCFAFTLIGGAIYPPTNYDAFCYRIPRILFWLQEGGYHWIGTYNSRLDFSSLGFEWLMLPGIAVFKTLRLAFLINAFSYLLMPGLIYSSFRLMGIRGPVAATWMWIIPCGSCFVMQAGSIGNDFTATIYLLASITFALKARSSGSSIHLALALISAGLCTCAKASNLPLILPLGICVLAALAKHPKLWASACCFSIISLLVSFAPLAVMNYRHTGDWTGSPGSIQNLENPLAGLAGNTLQIGVASVMPAVFPIAHSWNQFIKDKITQAPLAEIRKGFPELTLGTLEMASEESSGLGLGVTGAMLLAIMGSLRRFRPPDLGNFSIWIAFGFLISLLTVMAKLGNPSVPRIIACYYPIALLLPLMLFDQRYIIRSRIWKTLSLLLLLPILPALIFNPARPILRPDRIVTHLGIMPNERLMERLKTVYEVYEKRSDEHRKVRELLPDHAVNIGFAGTGGDSSYSFWLPLGRPNVRDFAPVNGQQVPSSDGLDAIVTSDLGSYDRFGLTPKQLAETIDWTIKAEVPIQRMARHEKTLWYVLTPAKPIRKKP